MCGRDVSVGGKQEWESRRKVLQRSLLCLRADRVTYQEGFFYESLSDAVKEKITGISYGEGCIVPYEELKYLQVLYMDFEGQPQVGKSYVTR